MNKRKIYQFHIKYPFIESIFLFLIGILVGVFSSLLTGEIISESDENWRIIDSWYLWIAIILVLAGVVYYWKFSSYSIGRQVRSSQIAADTIIETLANEAKRMLESDSPITFEKSYPL